MVKIPKKLSDFKKLLNSDNFNRFKCIFLPIDAVLKALKIMKKILIILFMFSFFSKVIAGNNGNAYDYEFNSIDGDLIKLSQYKGK